MRTLFMASGLLAFASPSFGMQGTCGNPTPLPCLNTQTVNFSTTATTASGLNPGCGGGINPIDLWYEITPSSSGTLHIDTCDSSYDTRLAIWANDCATVLACNDDDSTPCGAPQTDLVSSVNLAVTGGTTYLIQVGGFSGASGTGRMNITAPCPPLNDACTNPVALSSICGASVAFNTNGATASGMNPGCGGVSNRVDIWYSLTASATGTLVLDTCGSGFDTRIAVWTGCGGGVLACNDDAFAGPCAGSLLSYLEVPVTAGTTYLIQVGGFTSGTGTGILTVGPLGPANDDFADARPIVGCGNFAFDTNCASTDGPTSPLCNAFGSDQIFNDVWYTWVAPQTDTFTVQTCGGTFVDTKLAVMNAAGNTTLACNDDACGVQSSLSFAAVQGATYRIRVGMFSALDFGSGTFQISSTPDAQNYCAAGVNGSIISLTPESSLNVGANNFSLRANNLPNTNGIFYFGTIQTSSPFGGGTRCIGGSTFRIFIFGTPTGGVRTQAINLAAAPATVIAPGSCWNFQYWFRDASATSGFDLSNGLNVVFQ